MKFITNIKGKNWEEKATGLSLKLYYVELVLFSVSLFSVVYLSFNLLEGLSVFKKTLLLLFGIGGITSFHFLFQNLWTLWADLHDRIVSSSMGNSIQVSESVAPAIKSTIKIVFSSEDEIRRLKHVSFLQYKVSEMTGRDCEVIEAKTAEETLSYVTDHVVHLVIMDSHYKNELCFLLAEKIKKLDKKIPVIVCSSQLKLDNVNVDLWLRYLQRESDIEKLIPYFLSSTTINVTRIAKS